MNLARPLALTQDGDFLIESVDDSMAGVLQEALGKEAIFMETGRYHSSGFVKPCGERGERRKAMETLNQPYTHRELR